MELALGLFDDFGGRITYSEIYISNKYNLGYFRVVSIPLNLKLLKSLECILF